MSASGDEGVAEQSREWAQRAALAAERMCQACKRLSQTASLTDCRNELQTVFQMVQHLESEVRRSAHRRSAARTVLPQLERLRRQMAVCQGLVQHLVGYRADLAALVARGRAGGASPGARVWIEG